MNDAIQISVNEMREAFRRTFESNRDFWRVQGGLDEALGELDKAESLREIVQAVDPLLATQRDQRRGEWKSPHAKLGVWRSLYTRLMRSPIVPSPEIRLRFAPCWSGCRQR